VVYLAEIRDLYDIDRLKVLDSKPLMACASTNSEIFLTFQENGRLERIALFAGIVPLDTRSSTG
jgi:hypothetical protein